MPLRIAFDLDGVLADMDGELVRHAELVFGETMIRRLAESAPTDTPPSGTAGPNNAAGLPPSLPRSVGGPGKTRPTSDKAGLEAGATTGAGRAGQESDQESADHGEEAQLTRLQMTTRQQRRLWHHIELVENFWEKLKEIEPGSIARLAALAAERRWEIIFLTRRPRSAGFTSQVQSQRWLQAKGFPLPSVYVVQGSRGRIAAALDLDFVVDDTPENCLDVVVDSRARAVLVWREDEKHLPTAARRLGIGVVNTVDECLNILAHVDAPAAERTGMVDRVMRLLGLKESRVESR